MMTIIEIQEKINTFLVNNLEIEESSITPEAGLKFDLGLTSLDVQELRIFVQRSLKCQSTREDMLKISTLDDLYKFIESHQE